MEGSTQASRTSNAPSHIVDGNPGPYGGGTYTGGGNDPTVRDWENVFGPASHDIKVDHQRHKRQQRLHLPDALKGDNEFIAERIDGLITDATSSPFTTIILPYVYIEDPDRKLKWSAKSYDEGLASRVPYEAAARVLTQTKRSYAAYLVRFGLAIMMEHNFMMSAKGRADFQNQLRQLVGSIQYSNDLDVHVALVTAPSYAKEWAEKYHSSDKTPQQICREYVELFGFVQKNANAMDIMIEEAKKVLEIWGSPPPTFVMCNSKLTFNLQMNPDRTNYVTQGPDGLARLREGPNINHIRGLSIINSRHFSMETGAPPRDIMRRRIRVGEYYRIIPQGKNRQWEVQLYDESRDTWFTITKEQLDRASSLDPVNTGDRQLAPDEELTWDDYKAGGRFPTLNNTVHVVYPDARKPDSKLVKPRDFDFDFQLPSDFGAVLRNVAALQGGIFTGKNLRKYHYRTVIEGLAGGMQYLRPNAHNVTLHYPAAPDTTTASSWYFCHTAFLENTCALLMRPLRRIPEATMRESVFPFLYPAQDLRDAAIASWATSNTDFDGLLNPYQSVLVIALVASLHPDPRVRQILSNSMRDDRVNLTSLRSLVSRFARSAMQPRAGEEPSNKIQLGRILDKYIGDTFRSALVGPDGRMNESEALYDPWPAEQVNGVSITHFAGVSDTHDSLNHGSVELAYDAHPEYQFNELPVVVRNTGNVDENATLISFLYVALRRFFTPAWNPEEFVYAKHPYLEVQGDDSDDYEYVIIRPNIEHNMLGIILGRGGGPEELGATFWGNTNLACYDDSYYGLWGMSYKYHERAMVTNPRNMIRLWDVSYDGYNGGKDDRIVDWSKEAPGLERPFNAATTDMSVPYTGPSIMVMRFKVDTRNHDYKSYWPSPICFHDRNLNIADPPKLSPDPESIYILQDANMRIFNNEIYREQYRAYLNRMPDFSYFHQIRKPPGQAAVDLETSQNALAFQGSYRIRYASGPTEEINGSGHHGPDFIGVASLRAGNGVRLEPKAPTAYRNV